MRKLSLIGGIAAIALVPTFALAQQTCEQQRDNRVAATIGGGVVGALVGSAVAGHGEKGTGAVVGGVTGAVIGNQLAKPDRDCRHAYGYYDRSGAWHATDVDAAYAAGYYDREGTWVDGPPNGAYDSSGRWMAADARTRGYRDANGRWVPGGVQGYYDTDGRYVSARQAAAEARRADAYGYYDQNGAWHAANLGSVAGGGYYDRNGQWVQGEPNGRYDSNGQWIAASRDMRGYRDDNGRWVPGSVEGYYDTDGRYVTARRAQAQNQAMADARRADSYGEYDRDGQWRASGATRGSASGYYDRNGQWVVGAPGGGYDANGRWDVTASSAGDHGSDTFFRDSRDWSQAPSDIRAREAWLEQRIRAGAANGNLSRMDANRALRTLSGIRYEERRLAARHRGLTARDIVYLQAKLDALRADVRQSRRHDGN